MTRSVLLFCAYALLAFSVAAALGYVATGWIGATLAVGGAATLLFGLFSTADP